MQARGWCGARLGRAEQEWPATGRLRSAPPPQVHFTLGYHMLRPPAGQEARRQGDEEAGRQGAVLQPAALHGPPGKGRPVPAGGRVGLPPLPPPPGSQQGAPAPSAAAATRLELGRPGAPAASRSPAAQSPAAQSPRRSSSGGSAWPQVELQLLGSPAGPAQEQQAEQAELPLLPDGQALLQARRRSGGGSDGASSPGAWQAAGASGQRAPAGSGGGGAQQLPHEQHQQLAPAPSSLPALGTLFGFGPQHRYSRLQEPGSTAAPAPAPAPAPAAQGAPALLRAAAARCRPVLAELKNPPALSCLLSLVVGTSPPLRTALFSAGGLLRVVGSTIDMVGDCCVPLIVILLGATLEAGPGAAQVPWRVVAAVVACRLVLLPLLGLAAVEAALKLGLFTAPDPMFLVVMLLQNTVPTALNVHAIATIHRSKEQEVGALMFYQYLATVFIVPGWLMLFLHLAQRHAGLGAPEGGHA